MPQSTVIEAEPYPLSFEATSTALILIDMQRDFLEPGGFGELLGNDVSLLRRTIEPCKAVLEAARNRDLAIIHTREGHRPDLADAPPSKLARGKLDTGIGDDGPMGRIFLAHMTFPLRTPRGSERFDALVLRPSDPCPSRTLHIAQCTNNYFAGHSCSQNLSLASTGCVGLNC